MTSQTVMETPPAEISQEDELRRAILEHINEQSMVSLDTLTILIPQHSWNQVFQAVDRLARDGRIVLRRHGSQYTLFSVHFAA